MILAETVVTLVVLGVSGVMWWRTEQLPWLLTTFFASASLSLHLQALGWLP